jgi:hydrogenase expression/formation protein HypD
MCLAIPGKIVEIKGKSAIVDFGGVKRNVNISFVKAKKGDYVNVHAGFAIQKIESKEVKEVVKFLKNVDLQKEILRKIFQIASKIKRKVYLMEVCGTLTQQIAKYGIRSLLPKNVKLITGPGCPVCITPQEDIDAVLNLALNGIPIATYGDAIGLFESSVSRRNIQTKDLKIFSVYSVEDALKLKKQFKDLVFFGIGFETTAPMTAHMIKKGLTVFSAHRLFLPAMEKLTKMKNLKIDGFLCPGHVSTITGVKPYRKLKAHLVITGFELKDILEGIYLLLKQIADGKKEVENQYSRSVKEEGNKKAYKLIFEVFEVIDSNWRGIGIIKNSGLKIRKKFSKQDAKVKYKKILEKISFSPLPKTACKCGEIIWGLKSPKDCPLFAKVCRPENPIGPCMISVEGACNVEFRYGRKI